MISPVIDDLVALVRFRPAIGATRLVTLDGHSGAGEARLAGGLARALGRVPVVHLDVFYPGWDGLAAGVELAVDWVARPLVTGRRARWRRYDWTAGRFAEWQESPCAPIVVLEGCGAGSAALDRSPRRRSGWTPRRDCGTSGCRPGATGRGTPRTAPGG